MTASGKGMSMPSPDEEASRKHRLGVLAGRIEELRDEVVALARHPDIQRGMTRSDGLSTAERVQVFLSGVYREIGEIEDLDRARKEHAP
jgi:hypothetical protein